MNQKHPIDDLFRTKLVDYELPVREDLKQVFLNKTKPKKNRVFPFWILAIAASFIAVLSFMWIGLQGIPPEQSQELSTNESTKLLPTPKKEKMVDDNTKIETPLKIAKKAIVKGSNNINLTKTNLQKVTPQKSATGLEIMDEAIPDELTMALMNSQKPKENSSLRDNKIQADLFKKGVGETIIIIASEFQKEEEILIPEINSDSPVTMVAATAIATARSEENNSLLAKVFTNIKHLKHGEKLELSLTAQNTLPEDTFIGNETSEIKEKIDWIKTRISKR